MRCEKRKEGRIASCGIPVNEEVLFDGQILIFNPILSTYYISHDRNSSPKLDLVKTSVRKI